MKSFRFWRYYSDCCIVVRIMNVLLIFGVLMMMKCVYIWKLMIMRVKICIVVVMFMIWGRFVLVFCFGVRGGKIIGVDMMIDLFVERDWIVESCGYWLLIGFVWGLRIFKEF